MTTGTYAGTVLTVLVSLSRVAEAQFVADDLYVYYSNGTGTMNVTAGGDLSDAPVIATPGLTGVYGNQAWSRDRQLMYVASLGGDKVVTVSPAGTVANYATGVDGAISVLITRDGHILVGTFDDGEIYDITGGGDFSDATPLVTGIDHPSAMVQLVDGRVLVISGSGRSVVYDIDYPTGGEITAANEYATGLPNPVDIVQAPDGHIYVALALKQVFRITGGGSFASAAAFATIAEDSSHNFRALVARRDGTLLALTQGAGNVIKIYDITAGGEIASDAPAWATGIASSQAFEMVPACGDGGLQAAELCDDGNMTENDDCTNICTLAACGDGILHDQGTGTEQCDDFNAVDGDDCTNSCIPAVCGDGVVHDQGSGTEQCDDDNGSDSDDCTTSCVPASCGDGILNSAGAVPEGCDDGADNSDTAADACRTDCTVAQCGDSVVDTGEDCDEGADNSDTAADACRADCTVAQCGDSVVDTGEDCDEGTANGDGTCTTSCLIEEKSGGSCNAGGRGPGLEHLLLVAVLFLAIRRRRR